MLVDIKSVKVALKFPSKVMYHLMEDGGAVVDQRILMPIAISMELIAPNEDTLRQVNEVLMDRTSLYSVQSRGIIVSDLRVDYQGIRQAPDIVSATPTSFQFTQLMYQGQDVAVTAQSGDSSIVDRGLATLRKAQDTVASVSDKVASAFSSVF